VGEPGARDQKVDKCVAIQNMQKYKRRVKRAPQHAASFDPAESGFGESSHREVVFDLAQRSGIHSRRRAAAGLMTS
jgi:hypothetical protein